MPLPPSLDQTQPQILRFYTALHQLRPQWPGSLVLSLGLDPQGAALAFAANMAGAVSLSIDDDPARLREIVRTGAADFVVTTLDEAIRAMKNEVRKRSPLSVALNASPIATLEEIVERGLAPELFSSFLPDSPRIAQLALQLRKTGAALVHFGETAAPAPFERGESLLAPLLAEKEWHLHTQVFDSTAVLRDFDARALALLSPEDRLRRRWLEVIPRLLPRQRPPQRSLWLTETESKALL